MPPYHTTVPDTLQKSESRFRRASLNAMLMALLLPPAMGATLMGVIGFYPLPEVYLIFTSYSAPYVLCVVGVGIRFSRRLTNRVIALGQKNSAEASVQAQQLFKWFPWIVLSALSVYTIFGVISADISLEAMGHAHYTLHTHLRNQLATIPIVLITMVPIFFYFTDQAGRYLGECGLVVVATSMRAKLLVLGIVTPLLIDSVLVSYYVNKTGHFDLDTLMLWLGLLGIAATGTWMAWRSIRQAIEPLSAYLSAGQDVSSFLKAERLRPSSLDEFGVLTSRIAAMLTELEQRNQERDHAEVSLQTITNRLVEAQRTANIGNWELDLTTGGLYWSEQIFHIFDLDPVHFSPSYEAFLEVIHPEDRDMVNKAYTDSLVARLPYEIAHRLQMSDGQIKWVNERCRTDFDDQGNPLRSFGTVQDITAKKKAEMQIQEREERLRAIMDNADAVIFVKDLQGHYLTINSRYEALFHVDREEIRGRTDYEIFPREIADALVENDRVVIASSEPIKIEERVMQDDGLHTYLSVKFPLRDQDGQMYAICGIATDITEIKYAAAEYKSILQTSQDGFWLISAKDGSILDVNQAAIKMLGYTREEMLKMKIPDIDAGVGFREVEQEMQRLVVMPDYSSRFETLHRCKYGRTIDVEVSTQYLEERGGIFVAFIRDVTERKQIEAYNKRLLDILDRSTDMIASAGTDGQVFYMNAGGLALLGLPNDIDIGQLQIRNVHPDWAFQKAMQEGIPAAIRDGHWQGETALLHRDGHEIPVSQLIMFHAQHQIGQNYLSTIMRDISEPKQLQVSLLKAKEQAEAANRAKSVFLANMSHEIRTPMNSILGLTQLVLDSKLQPQQENYLRKVMISSQSLLGILNDILDYSKIEAGHMEIERVPLRVEDVLSSVADLFSVRVEEKGLELYLDIDPDLPAEVIGDPLRLTQVLNNLVGNAVKFTDAGEVCISVTAAVAETEMTLNFAVHDTGIGLAPEQTEQLFQPFAQADGSVTRRYGGTGLGLAICQQLVTLMGGQIWATGTPGVGATFHFSIRVDCSEEVTISDLQQVSGLRILVVDDQETARQILRHLLVAWRLNVETAASGAEALERFEQAEREKRSFDVVLLDWRMPGMGGIEVAKRLLESSSSQPQILMMTPSLNFETLKSEAGALGIDGLLPKPVIPSHLLDLLTNRRGRSALNKVQKNSSQAAMLRFDGTHVLLVEDNAINQEVASAFLEQRGVTVTVANDGAEALEWVGQQCFDAVLMDLHMPGMDGIEATRRIRLLPECQKLPIIAMTAAVLSEDRARCAEIGMVDFVAKPVNPGELIRCLQRWLPQHTQAAAIDKSTQVALPNLPGFQLDLALVRLDGDCDRLTRLLRRFAEEKAGFLPLLEGLLNAGQLTEAADLLHALSGAAASIGVAELAAEGLELEAKLRAGELPSSRDRFAQALTSALAAIATLSSQISSEPKSVQTKLNRQRLTELFNALLPYLRSGELAPDELIQDLNKLAQDTTHQKLLTSLLKHIDNFDHEAALMEAKRLATILELELHS